MLKALIAMQKTKSTVAHQREPGSQPRDQVQSQYSVQEASVLYSPEQRPIALQGDVEGLALVVDSKGAQLDCKADQPAHRVDKVRGEISIRLLRLVLHSQQVQLSYT